MSIAETRGGGVEVFRADVTTSGLYHFLKAFSKWICIRATTNACKVFFTEADFNAVENYIAIPASGEWKGPLETNKIWFIADANNSSVELVVARRLN